MTVAQGRVLRTGRLTLRWLAPGDEPLLLAIWNDPAFVQNVGDRGIRTFAQATEALVNGPLQLYSRYGYGPYRVSLADSDTAIGLCGLFRRDNLDDPDIGFAMLPDFCGRGFAYESAAAVLAHARDTLELPKLTAIVSPSNAASIGLIEKLGLRYECDYVAPGEDEAISLYAIHWERAE